MQMLAGIWYFLNSQITESMQIVLSLKKTLHRFLLFYYLLPTSAVVQFFKVKLAFTIRSGNASLFEIYENTYSHKKHDSS